MPIYKMEGKKDGLQKYRVRINYIDHEGKSRQLDRVAYGSQSAKELERRLNRELKEKTTKKITLRQLYDEYIAVKQYEVRENTMRTIRGRLSLYVLPELGSYRIDKLNSAILQKWKQYIESCTNSKKPSEKLSSSMKKSIFGEFRAMLNYAVRMEYLIKILFAPWEISVTRTRRKKRWIFTPPMNSRNLKPPRSIAPSTRKRRKTACPSGIFMFFSISLSTRVCARAK